MRIGLALPHYDFSFPDGEPVTWERILSAAQRAEALGFDSGWVSDHFFLDTARYGGTDELAGSLEPFTVIAALAARTERLRLGTLVAGAPFRHAAHVAKTATALDLASDGRFDLGLGAGWYELEHRSFGLDFKTLRGRLEALDESCQIVNQMFTQDRTSFAGKHYKVADAVCNPKPMQKPRIPIMIGGRGEKSLLKIVAKHADMWNTMHSNPAEMKRLIDVIERHGDTVGRDTDEIEKTIMLPLCYKASKEREQMIAQVVAGMARISPEQARDRIMIGDKDECLDKVAAYRKVGVTHFIFNLRWPILVEDEFQAFAEEVIPAVERN